MGNLSHEMNPTLGHTRNVLLLSIFAMATVVILDIGSVSFSFVFGSVLILLSLKDYNFFFVPRGLTVLLVIFVIVALLSLLLSVVPAISSTPIRAVQLIYWLLLALFVYNAYDYIEKSNLSKVIFFAVLVFLILDITFLSIAQNAVAFTVIIMGPLGFYFLKRYSYMLFYSVLLMFLILLNGSRAGAILSFMQTILFFFLFTPRFRRYARFFILGVFLLTLSLNLSPVRIAMGKLINPYNDRVGEFLINPEKVFRNDTSWLQRRAQINKGRQIFELHPLLGIGIFNFPRYGIKIDISNIETDRKQIRNIDNRSAHNSYVALLAETGILGFSSIILMFAVALWRFLKNLNQIGGTFEACVFISFMGLLAYFYTISGFFGSSAWLIYGLILGASEKIISSVLNQKNVKHS